MMELVEWEAASDRAREVEWVVASEVELGRESVWQPGRESVCTLMFGIFAHIPVLTDLWLAGLATVLAGLAASEWTFK
jgi:hypothetical protein